MIIRSVSFMVQRNSQRHLVHSTPNEGDVLAFKNDTNEQYKDFLQIVKIDTLDWYETMYWLHTNQTIIETMNAQYSQVILLNASCMGVNTSKIIPIPLFLVSFFMNRGLPCSTLATCQAFHTVIFHNALTNLPDCLQHVRNLLIVAAGAETNPQDTTKLPSSQLAIKMESVPLDQIIHPWAEHQQSKIIPAAAAYNARKAPPHNMQSPQLSQQENQRVERNALGMDSQLGEWCQMLPYSNTVTTMQAPQVSSRVMSIKITCKTESSQNDNTAQYPEYVPEREKSQMSRTQMWDTSICSATQITVQLMDGGRAPHITWRAQPTRSVWCQSTQ